MFMCRVTFIATPCSVAVASVLHSFVNIKKTYQERGGVMPIEMLASF